MGFNKRYIDLKIIEDYISNGKSLNKLFKSDALIFTDSISSEIYDWFCDGLDIEIKLKEYESKRI